MGGGHVEQSCTEVYCNLGSTATTNGQSKSDECIILLSRQFIFGIIHLPARGLPNCGRGDSRRWERLRGKRSTVHFFSRVSIDVHLTRNVSPTRSQSQRRDSQSTLLVVILVTENTRQCIRSVSRSNRNCENHSRKGEVGTNGNYAKRFHSRRGDGRRITLSTSRRWRFPRDPHSLAAAKDTILWKVLRVIGTGAHKESHKVEGYLQEDMR